MVLQHQDVCHQSLGVQLVRGHAHDLVHQLGAEDGEEVLPDDSPLRPAGTWGTVPKRALPRLDVRLRGTDADRAGPEWALGVGSAVLTEGWLAGRDHAAAGVRRGDVEGQIGPGDEAGGLEGTGTAAAAGWTAGRTEVLLDTTVRPILLMAGTPCGLHQLTVHGSQTRVLLILGGPVLFWTLDPNGAVVQLAGLILPGLRLPAGALVLPALTHMLVFV